MLKKEATITAQDGLHMRPIAQLVKAAKEFSCEIHITSGSKSASAKSVAKLQLLGLTKDTVVTISAEGQDAQQAVESLAKLIPELK